MFLVLAGAAPAPPAPAPPGALSCSGCHGTAMPIAGRDAKDLTGTLTTFRSGARPSTLMGRLTNGFSVEELAAIAAYWAGAK